MVGHSSIYSRTYGLNPSLLKKPSLANVKSNWDYPSKTRMQTLEALHYHLLHTLFPLAG